MNGMSKGDAGSISSASGTFTPSGYMQFLFTHGGRTLEADQTPEEAGLEDGDEILAVELMDLTDGPGTEIIVSVIVPHFEWDGYRKWMVGADWFALCVG